MKSNHSVKLSFLGIFGSALVCWLVAAEQSQPVDRVLLKNGVLAAVQGGLSFPLTNTVTLPHDIKVMTNGTFKVNNGKARPLLEGQVLAADGMLTSADGSLRPVFDNVAFLNNRSVVVKDGEASPLLGDFDLPDGRRVTADGYLLGKSGERRKLLDGETIALTGQIIPVNDTISLRDGKVIVQKDGSLQEVPPGRSLMMNDGTKVYGDGTVVLKDGTQKHLGPDEILKVEGVMPKTS